MQKSLRFEMRLTAADDAALKRLAVHRRAPASEVIRALIHEADQGEACDPGHTPRTREAPPAPDSAGYKASFGPVTRAPGSLLKGPRKTR